MNIHEAKRGIRGRFDVENFRTRGNKIFDAGEIGSNLADGDAHVGENIAHQAVGAAIGLRRGNDFVARF